MCISQSVVNGCWKLMVFAVKSTVKAPVKQTHGPVSGLWKNVYLYKIT